MDGSPYPPIPDRGVDTLGGRVEEEEEEKERRKAESLAHAVEATKYTAGIPDRSRSRTGGEERKRKERGEKVEEREGKLVERVE